MPIEQYKCLNQQCGKGCEIQASDRPKGLCHISGLYFSLIKNSNQSGEIQDCLVEKTTNK